MHYYDHDFIYNYGLGYRLDSPKCKPGNKPCGKTCIPSKSKCRINKAEKTRKRVNPIIPGTIAGLATLGLGGLAITGHKKVKESKKRMLDDYEKYLDKVFAFTKPGAKDVDPEGNVVHINEWKKNKDGDK